MKSETEIKDMMLQALARLMRVDGSFPAGRQDVQIGDVLVRVYGVTPGVRNITTVQLIVDGKGYSANVGKSRKLGKLGTYTP